ncbi:MAG: hypothetical protein J1E36_06540 [Eubacterium sp.]|nr:hypothetical protein [Eubacterium sp.]
MRKYNYFDDEPEVIESKNKKIIIPRIDFSSLAESIKRSSKAIAHGEALQEVKELNSMPNLKKLALKLLAFVLFIIFIVVFILIFSHSISSQNKKNALFYTDAGKVCTDYITNYGSVKWESMDSDTYGKDMARLTGLCYARQMDFDNDGSDELMLVYNNKNIYTLEVWSYVKKEFVKVYSHEANSTEDVKDGSWIGLYHQSNKYYICKSEKNEPEKVNLYALKKDTFSKTSSCDYDYKNNIYSVNGKINAQDFETIKFSVIKSSRAEAISETVIANIDSFHTVSIIELENQKTPEQLKAAAYYEVIENRNNMYGKAKVKAENGKSYIDGVGLVKLVDFNNDGNDELFIVYRKKIKQSATNYYTGEAIIIEEPTYCMEVYSWNGTLAKKIFSKDSISNLLYDNDTNYVMLQNSKNSVDICTNFYTYKSNYTYTASSRIYSLKEEEFEPIFNVKLVSEYGYKSYYINNEYTYRSTFEDKAYRVPMFLDDDGEYDKEKYTVVYLSGDKKENLNTVVNNTIKAIESLNSSYIAEDE